MRPHDGDNNSAREKSSIASLAERRERRAASESVGAGEEHACAAEKSQK